eukprot:s2152_g2.t1
MGPKMEGHVPILHQIALFWAPQRSLRACGISKQQGMQAKVAYADQTAQWHQYLAASAEVLSRELQQVVTSNDPFVHTLQPFHDAVNACFHDHFPPMRAIATPASWQKSVPMVLNKWQHRACLRKILSCTGSGVFRAWYHLAKYTALKRRHRQHAAKIRRHHFLDVVQTAQNAAAKHDMHQLFRIINSHAPKAPRRRIQLRNHQGAIASPSEELQILTEFVKDVWGGPTNLPITFPHAPGVPFSVFDLAKALSRIPLNKAVAFPFAPGIAWKDHSMHLAQLMYPILELWWSQNPPYIPRCWKNGWLLLIGVQVMLDLERAFDGVARYELFSQLHTLGVHEDVANLLTHWHDSTQYHIQHGQDTIDLDTGGGLRQGCKAAPGLWNSLLLLFLRRAAAVLPISWLRSHLNIYADDFHVGGVYYSLVDLQLLLKAFGILLDTFTAFKLKINPRKSTALLTIAGTSCRGVRQQIVQTKDGVENLCIPAVTGNDILIPIQQQANYLGTIMTYKDCSMATVHHRVALARIAQRRLGRWLGGKHVFRVAQRYQLWKSCVFPVLCHGLFAIGLSDIAIHKLQKVMLVMLRQVICDHSFHTGHTHQQALTLHRIPTPLQQLRAAASQLLTSVTQRLADLPSDDITLQISWQHLQSLIHQLDTAQDLGALLVEPPSVRQVPELLHRCVHCGFLTSDVAVFRRHCTIQHGYRVDRTQFALTSSFTQQGLPTCKFCSKTFATWRTFQIHIDRGCEALFPGHCAADSSVTSTGVYLTGTMLAAHALAVRGQTQLTDSDLQHLRQLPFGSRLCQIVEQRAWHQLEREVEACAYLRQSCALCGHRFSRVQELNAHYRQHHGQFWDGVPNRAVILTNTWASESPCGYCGALFRTHLCPIWVQVTVLLLHGADSAMRADSHDDEEVTPRFRCEVCLDMFSTPTELAAHLRECHQLQGISFHVGRDSISGEPACSHCGALYDTLSGLRSHIVQGRCEMYNPYAVEESLTVEPTWVEACVGGNMKILLGNPQDRLRLTIRCQLCGVAYTRAADLAGHLQGGHARLWRQSQQLTMLLVHMLYSFGQCRCNPMIGQRRNSHVCLPLRQLSMIYCRLESMLLQEGRIFAPFQVSDSVLESMLSRQLDRSMRFQLEQFVANREFSNLWTNAAVLEVLKRQCLFCGQEHDPAAMCPHLREAHPGTHPAVSFYIGELTALMQLHLQNDYQCYACGQIFNLPSEIAPEALTGDRQRLAQYHLLHHCPCLLQVALFLTGLLTDGRFNHDHAGPVGSPTDAGHVQRPAASTGAGANRSGPAGSKSKRAKAHQNMPSAAATAAASADHSGATSTGPDAADVQPGATAGTFGATTRPRHQPVPPHGQLHSFFPQRTNRKLEDVDTGGRRVAGEEEVIDLAHDGVEAASLPGDVSRSPHQGDQDLRGPEGGPSVDNIGEQRPDSCGWRVAVLGVESSSADHGSELPQTHHHGENAPTLCGVSRNGEESGLDPLLSEFAGEQREQGDTVENAAQPQERQRDRTSDPALQKWGVDTAGGGLQAAHIASEQPGRCYPEITGAAEPPSQRQRQGPGERPLVVAEQPCDWAAFLHVLSHVRLKNAANWCYANTTIMCLLWTLMSVDCELHFLGDKFVEVIQFLPCHNMQLVALADLPWFQRLLQMWGHLQGSQCARQQDSSEFTAAVLSWLQAPAVNMTWEKRLDENDSVRPFDIGGPHIPLQLSFPESHAHQHDFEFTISELILRWSQVDGMTTALVQAPQLLCLHLDRLYHDDAGNLQKSPCLINLEATCDVPIFTGSDLRKENVFYVLVACSAHLGDAESGHYRALLKLRPIVLPSGQPASWLVTEDNVSGHAVWRAPDWFRSNATDFWLVRADCVQLHVYRPASMDMEETEVPEVHSADHSALICSSAPSTGHGNTPDETEEAILAMLQATKAPIQCSILRVNITRSRDVLRFILASSGPSSEAAFVSFHSMVLVSIGSFLAPLLEELLVLATFAFSFTLWRRLKPARKEALFEFAPTKPKDGFPAPQKVFKAQEDFTEEEQEHAKTTEKEMQDLFAWVPGIGF